MRLGPPLLDLGSSSTSQVGIKKIDQVFAILLDTKTPLVLGLVASGALPLESLLTRHLEDPPSDKRLKAL